MMKGHYLCANFIMFKCCSKEQSFGNIICDIKQSLFALFNYTLLTRNYTEFFNAQQIWSYSV